MSQNQNELNIIESKLNALQMGNAERAVAIVAFHRAFIIVERLAWAANAVGRINRLWRTETFQADVRKAPHGAVV